ncbi:SDR family NAD(P)-dependent oxidoreductase [Aeromicrobium choanae]|uniref:3-oxoacyl-[acyl-carrier protein] reductase n=1 Tax=Aeromicrobium choanae TaxID=1736691 RepID=A0A1T4YXT5_9ACTN|nr:SDR family oxidoreductase [Aeromicrobium choanae]SKB06368.1 3-oxoacyl-[acyl-carrier protein] reductase [Aeromicrobium choanae]
MRETIAHQRHDLRGMTAVVTGAARGLGRAYTLRLAELGADVAVVDRDLLAHREFARERDVADEPVSDLIAGLGRRFLAFELDVADEAAVTAACRSVHDAWGRIDILVVNAGGGSGLPSETTPSLLTKEVISGVLEANLYGTTNFCGAVAPVMKSQHSGRIVTVSSVAGSMAMAGGEYAHYGAAKSAIAMYTRYLAQEMAPFGVNVNCMAPGLIATGRVMERLTPHTTGAKGIPLGRAGTVEDCANLLEFLVTPLSDFITGAVIPIDGGRNVGTS